MARNTIARSEALNGGLSLVVLIDGRGNERTEVVMRERIAEGAHKCRDCGEVKDDVELVLDPVEWDVFGNVHIVKVCNACYDERELEI